MKQFRVSLPNSVPSSSDYLVIKAAPTTYASDPDLYVFKGNYDTPVKVCAKLGADDCFINLKKEQANTAFLFQVKCAQKCDFNLKAEFISSQSVDFGALAFINFDEFSSKVFDLRIPSETTNGQGQT